MKKLLFLLLFTFGTVFAQSYTPNYNKYSVSVSAGSDLLRGPFTPKFAGGVTFGYKFAANYDKVFDTVYGTALFTGNTRTDLMTYHVGVQRTMMNEHDRMGILLKTEGGVTTLFGRRDVTKPSVAAGIGLGFDFSGSPYPKWMNHTVLSFVPMTNKVVSRPVYETLTLGFTKTFK